MLLAHGSTLDLLVGALSAAIGAIAVAAAIVGALCRAWITEVAETSSGAIALGICAVGLDFWLSLQLTRLTGLPVLVLQRSMMQSGSIFDSSDLWILTGVLVLPVVFYYVVFGLIFRRLPGWTLLHPTP